MNNYLLTADDQKKEIIKIEVSKSYSFKPKKMTRKYVNAKSITVYDEAALANILMQKYIKRYNRLISIVSSIIESDDTTDSDYMMCLDELEKLKGMLVHKYAKFLKKEIYDKFITDLIYIDNFMKEKIIALTYEEQTRSGR